MPMGKIAAKQFSNFKRLLQTNEKDEHLRRVDHHSMHFPAYLCAEKWKVSWEDEQADLEEMAEKDEEGRSLSQVALRVCD